MKYASLFFAILDRAVSRAFMLVCCIFKPTVNNKSINNILHWVRNYLSLYFVRYTIYRNKLKWNIGKPVTYPCTGLVSYEPLSIQMIK
jgi:hypothetical protein